MNKIKEFYIVSIYEVLCGTSLKELQDVVFEFEKEELYEECSGIKKAIDFCEKKTITEIEYEYLELINKQDGK